MLLLHQRTYLMSLSGILQQVVKLGGVVDCDGVVAHIWIHWRQVWMFKHIVLFPLRMVLLSCWFKLLCPFVNLTRLVWSHHQFLTGWLVLSVLFHWQIWWQSGQVGFYMPPVTSTRNTWINIDVNLIWYLYYIMLVLYWWCGRLQRSMGCVCVLECAVVLDLEASQLIPHVQLRHLYYWLCALRALSFDLFNVFVLCCGFAKVSTFGNLNMFHTL